MSLEIITTPLEDANGYVDLEEANQILATLPDAQTRSWFNESLNDLKKKKLLITATRIIDENFTFIGRRSINEQALQWPRAYVPIDGIWPSGVYIADYVREDVVPSFIKVATADLARHLATTDILEKDPIDDLEEVQVGKIRVKFNLGNNDTQIPPSVLSTLQKWGHYQGNVGKEEAKVTSITLSR